MHKSIRVADAPRSIQLVPVLAAAGKGTVRLPTELQSHEGARHALRIGAFTGEAGSVHAADDRILLIGLGPREGLDLQRIRTVAAKLGRVLVTMRATAVRAQPDWTGGVRSIGEFEAGSALAEGLSIDSTGSMAAPRAASRGLRLFASGRIYATFEMA